MPEIIGLAGIKQILGGRQAVLRLQPIYEFSTGKPVQHESLMRLLDSSGDEVPPQQFLSAVVQHGLLPELDMMTLNLVESQLGALRGGLQTPVGLNISSRSLSHQPYIDYLCSQTWLDILDHIVLELKTGDVSKNPQSLAQLAQLKKRGVKISLDYQGGGAPMVQLVAKSGFDYLKFDTRPFSLTYTDSERQQAGEALRMAKSHNIQVIFERVETEHDLKSVRPYLPDMLQGYLFGFPQFGFSNLKTPLLGKAQK